ncbi:MAG: FtsX-like permease family protein [Polyangiales bacterium]
MTLGFIVRMLVRQGRAARGRFAFFVACIAAGVAAVVGVAALSDAVEHGIAARSRELLGGDLALEGRSQLPEIAPLLPEPMRRRLVAQNALCVLSSVVRNSRGQSRLAELKAIADPRSYPLVGALTLTPPQPLAALLNDDSVLVARSFLEAGELAVGDSLYVGGVAFRVAGVIEREPDPLDVSFVYGARVLMTRAGLDRTQLLGLGHRVRYRNALRFDARTTLPELEALKTALEKQVPGGGSYVRVETHADAQPALRNTLDRARHYLALIALLSLLIAASGVAQIVSAWLAQVTPETAVLRCLGLRPRDVLRLYVVQIVWLALLGSVSGALLGTFVPLLVARGYPDMVPPGGMAVPWWAIARGCGLGVVMACVFSLPPLLSVYRVSPARVLRADAEPLPITRRLRVMTFGVLALSVLLAAWAQTESLMRAAAFSGGLVAITTLSWLAARGLLWAIARLPRTALPAEVWHGASAWLRPGAGLVASSVALGIGNLVVLSIGLVQDIMSRELVSALPADAPSVFMLDIQSDQWPDVERLARDARGSQLQQAPVVMARLSAVDGRPVDDLVHERARDKGDEERERWVLTREQRITSLRELPDNNQVVAGELWKQPGVNEISVETEFARDLGAGLGTRLRFDVQGVPVDFVVTSLRKVEWRRFAVSFFLVAKPGVLDDAPKFLLGAVRLPREREQHFQDELAKLHPNITVVRVRELLERAADLVGQLGFALSVLGLFGVVVGSIMLAGSIAAGQLRRAREVALLKTLGLTRARIITLFAVEYALLGAVAGITSAASAYALTLAFTRVVLDLNALPSIKTCLAGAAALCVLAVLAGLLASTRALRVPPLTVLREPV